MTQDSDQILRDARNTLANVRHNRSIGMKSRALKWQHRFKKIGRIAMAAGAVLVGMGIVGAIVNGIGFGGVMVTGLLVAATTAFFAYYPKMPMPTPEKLSREELRYLPGKTEIWLEAQRPALPAPAVQLIDGIGVQLDALAPQLQSLDDKAPAAREVRKLVGEHLPELITGYRKIPAHLRGEERNGQTPDKQLVEGLGVIKQEIATMTRQLAEGDIDQLSTRSRFLEIRYTGDDEAGLGKPDGG